MCPSDSYYNMISWSLLVNFLWPGGTMWYVNQFVGCCLLGISHSWTLILYSVLSWIIVLPAVTIWAVRHSVLTIWQCGGHWHVWDFLIVDHILFIQSTLSMLLRRHFYHWYSPNYQKCKCSIANNCFRDFHIHCFWNTYLHCLVSYTPTRISIGDTVYPKEYAHGFCFAVLC